MSKNEILIFEVSDHVDYIYTTAGLAEEAGYNVTIMTVEKIYNLALPLINSSENDVKWIVLEDDMSNWMRVKKLKEHCDKHSCIVLINTLYCVGVGLTLGLALMRFNAVLHASMGRTYLWFEPYEEITIFKGILRRWSLNQILKKVETLIVHSKNDIEYLVEKGITKRILYLPWYLRKEEYTDINTRTITIADRVRFGIVGMIDNRRRDYEKVLDVFEDFWNSGYNKFELDLIGGPNGDYGRQIISRCLRLAAKGYPIHLSKEYLETEDFLKRVSECDILLSAMNVSYYERNQSSAIVTEQIRAGKPALLPTEYRMRELESSTIYYDRLEDLAEIIPLEFTSADKMEKLKKEATNNANKFTFKAFADKFNKHLGTIMENTRV